MTNLQPLRREDLPEYETMFAMIEQNAGFIPNAFLTMARRPELLDALQLLIKAVFAGSVPRETKSLVALMTSYGAGCRYCQAHQASSLVHQGIAAEKLAAVAYFETAAMFSGAERAAMRLAFASGQHPNAATAAHFAELREFFDDGEIVEIVGVIGTFGFLNRWHETVSTDLEAKPTAIAIDALGSIGWDPGRHAGR
ncbi:MAG: carboxymuconolactone decarboxylase family protein [Acidimicrobiales bacterium]